MASYQNNVEPRCSQRQNKKRIFADYVTTTPETTRTTENKQKQTEHCTKCLEVFANKKLLKHHQKQCLALTKQDSFGKYIFNKEPYDTTDKVLPLSQTLTHESPNGRASATSSPPQPITPGTYATALKAQVRISPVQMPRTKSTQSAQMKSSQQTPATSASNTTVRQTKEKTTPTRSTEETAQIPAPGRPTQSSTTATKSTHTRGHGQQQQNPTSTLRQAATPANHTTPIDESTRSNARTTETIGVTNEIYSEITQWRRNLFKLPKGNLGKKFVDEKTKLLNRWVETNEEKSLALLMMMPNLLLQRSSKKAKARENKDHLTRRMEMWENGKLRELMEEGKSIQKRLPKLPDRQSDEEMIKAFRNHMLKGNVNAALRLLNKANNKGILPITEETMKLLHEKHPTGEPLHEEMLLSGPIQQVHSVIFDDINGDLVRKVAMKMKGAAGPSSFDSDDWKTILVSRQFGTSSNDLCDAIAKVTKTLCTENRTEQGGMSALMACRLIPLNKDPGLRPIGIGEVLRRIIGKIVVYILRAELQEDAGELQMCVGQAGGCEAGVHAMCEIFDDDDTHGIIQVDANNAFNTINRQVFLHNI